MKKIVTLYFVIISFGSFSQDEDLEINDSNYSHHLFEFTSFTYEQKFFQHDWEELLKSTSDISINSLSVEMISLRLNGYFIQTDGYNYPGYWGFSYVLPKKIYVKNSIQKLRGFFINFPLAGQKIIKRNNFGIYFNEGVQLGRLKLVNERKEKMKNMIIAPYLGLVTRFTVSKFSLFISAQYDWDISKKQWKKQWFHKKQEMIFPGINQSGLTFTIGLNFSNNIK